jgi:hypothetical protein
MKKYGKIILLSIGVVTFLASCQCKTCKREGDPSQTFCKDQGSQSTYDNTIQNYQNAGYTCQ